jgi:hypothetical protein
MACVVALFELFHRRFASVPPSSTPSDVAAGYAVRDAIGLDRLPGDWTPSSYRFVDREFSFRPDRMKKPAPDLVERWRRDYPLVRPIPYPYFVGLSIPNDCCGSLLADLYYSSALLSRKYGLDFPSSFWVYDSQPGSPLAAFLTDDDRGPACGAVEVEGDKIDVFSLLLTYYYRGWLDHLHQWSAETGVAHSLVTPQKVEVASGQSASTSLEMSTQGAHSFDGLEIGLDVEPDVKEIVLELTDATDRSHFLVYGVGLEDRPGWDLSALPRTQLRQTYLHLCQERNRQAESCLGRARYLHLKSAKVLVRGAPGASVTVRTIRPFDLSRGRVWEQMELMRSWNILPTCSTNHGGNSSWGRIDRFNFSYPYKDPLTGYQFTIERPPVGACPTSPSYCADLLTDFGVIFQNVTGFENPTGAGVPLTADIHTLPNLLRVWQRPDGKKMYLTKRWAFMPTAEFPDVTPHHEHCENLGGCIVRYLANCSDFGHHWILYTHHNIFNPTAFQPPGNDYVRMTAVRQMHPYAEQALAVLACLKYNLDGAREYHQRVWCCPLGVAHRFAQARRGLADHTRLYGNDVHIDPWQDEVTEKPFPDPRFAGQDLHGQTFYVPDATAARVFCGGVEITALKRNPPDFTGRPSVTVVDTETPTVVFDEVKLADRAGTVEPHNARLAYTGEEVPRGRLALEVRSVAQGEAAVVWKPNGFDNFETDFVHLFYRKTNPRSEMEFSWTDAGGREYVVTEGELRGRQGWEIGRHTGAGDREIMLEYADMQGPARGEKIIPRGAVAQFRFGLRGADRGDVVVFDRVEFLSARGVRPTAGNGLVVGGRLSNHQDGVRIQARGAGEVREVLTGRGGWYAFQNVPRESVLEISCVVDQRPCRPARGRRIQVSRNDLECHIRTGP